MSKIYSPILAAIQVALGQVDALGQQSMVDSFAAVAAGDYQKSEEITSKGMSLVAQHDFLLDMEKTFKIAVMVDDAERGDASPVEALLAILAGRASKPKKEEPSLAQMLGDILAKKVDPVRKVESEIDAMMKDMLTKGIGIMRINPEDLFGKPDEVKAPPPENKAQCAAYAAKQAAACETMMRDQAFIKSALGHVAGQEQK